MVASRLDAVYVTYWSFRDPLCLSQSLPVVRDLRRRGWRMALMTFEQEPWVLPPEERQETRAGLSREGIEWVPLSYHKRPAVVSTLFDIALGAVRCAALARRRGARLVHGRAAVPGAIAHLASRLAGTRFFYDADGPLAEEYVDAGLWKRGSLPYRLTSWGEARSLKAADALAVLSERRRRELKPNRKDAVVLPCAVDTALFKRDPRGAELRRELGLGGTVFVYAGKAGGWYLLEPMLDFVAAYGRGSEASLLVLSGDDPRLFAEPAAARGLRCVVRRAARDEMPRYLSAADVALSFRRPASSSHACSPVKNGEYLACGLPVVTTAGIGDYSELIARARAGIVVEGLDPAGLADAAERLRGLLAEAGLSARCREAAVAEVGLSEVVLPRYAVVYEGLLGPAPAAESQPRTPAPAAFAAADARDRPL